MISYVRQVAICESVRETIKRTLLQTNDMGVRQKVNDIPTADGILRVVSLNPKINTEETLLDFITEYVVSSLRLTAIQKEQLNLNSCK
jgi:hypothetical protein